MRKLTWTSYLIGVTTAMQTLFPDTGMNWRWFQAINLRRIVRIAYRRVPFYRRYMIQNDISPRDIRTVEDLRKLPLTSKKDYLSSPQDFIPVGIRPGNCIDLRTSGTTGQPGSYLQDTPTMMLNIAAGERERRVINQILKKKRNRELIFRHPGSSFLKVQQFYNQSIWRPRRALGRYQRIVSTSNPIATNLDIIDRFRPHIISAHGTYLSALFHELLHHRTGFWRPQLVVYTADAFWPETIRMMEEDFGIRVVSHYRSCEAVKIGFTCENSHSFHIHSDLCDLYLIDADGQTPGPGKIGEVVISNLINTGAILLNYRMDDLAFLEDRLCACGRTLPRLKSLEGRRSDNIVLPDGRTINSHRIKVVFTGRRDVKQFQVIQRDPWEIQIKLLPSDKIDRNQAAGEIKSDFIHLFGKKANIHIQFVASFDFSDRKKFRPVVALKK